MKNIDVYSLLQSKNPRLARRIPRFVINYMSRVIHQQQVNEILAEYSDLSGVDFVRAALAHMNVSYRASGMQRLDRGKRYVFASNHPFGGMDGLMLADEVHRYFGDVKVIVNDLLMNLDPIKQLFIPVNKHGRQSADAARLFNETFASDVPVVTFPAGLCSRRHGGVVSDADWKPNFIKKAAVYDREIVPVYFDGQLSNFFYRLSNFRKAVGVKANIEMMFLVDEMFRQAGKSFEIVIGEPMSAARLLENHETAFQAAQSVKQTVYSLAAPNSGR